MNHRNGSNRPEPSTRFSPSTCLCVAAPSRSWFGTKVTASCLALLPRRPGGSEDCRLLRVGLAVVAVPLIVRWWHLAQVNWLPDTNHRNQSRLLSVSTDGKILVWREERGGRLALAEGFALVAQQIPRSAQLKRVSWPFREGWSDKITPTAQPTGQSSPCLGKGPQKAPFEHTQ